MSRRYRPRVLAGPLSQADEDAIWSAAFAGALVRAQPITGWLLSSAWHWGDERSISTALAKAFSISHKALEAGAPKRRSTFLRALKSMGRFLEQKMAELTPESAARRERALKRTADALSQDISATPCTMFHQTIGAAGGDLLEALAIALDGVSAEVLTKSHARSDAHEMVVRAAESVGVVRPGAVIPQSTLDPGLDALLALMARLDRDWTAELCVEGSISSIFALLIDSSGREKRQRPAHRLLDIYYGLAFFAKRKSLPDARPRINQIEAMLLAEVPESGVRSPIVRWRGGHTILRFERVEEMIALLEARHAHAYDRPLRLLWIAAEMWDLIELSGADAARVAGARYRQWWDAMESEGRTPALLTHPYWKQFQPHA